MLCDQGPPSLGTWVAGKRGDGQTGHGGGRRCGGELSAGPHMFGLFGHHRLLGDAFGKLHPATLSVICPF